MVSSAGYQREYQRAIEAFAQEEYTQAVELFSQVALARPEDLSLKLWLASAQQQAGQLAEARRNYEFVLQSNEDPELAQVARAALEQLRDLMPEPPSTAGTIPVEDLMGDDSPFENSLFGGGSFNQGGFGGIDDIEDGTPLDDLGDELGDMDDIFSPNHISSAGGDGFPEASEGNPFDDLFDTGLEMLNEIEQTSIDVGGGPQFSTPVMSASPVVTNTAAPPQVNPGHLPATDATVSAQTTTPLDDFLGNSAKLDSGKDEFAFLNDLDADIDDLDADNITQVAADDAFSFSAPVPVAEAMPSSTSRTANTMRLPLDAFPTEFASPISEPIPAPDVDTAAPESGTVLFDMEDLDNLDQEIAMMDTGEQLDDLFAVPSPVESSRATSSGREGGSAPVTPSVPAVDLRSGSVKPTVQVGPPWLQNRPAASKQLLIALVQGAASLITGGIIYGVVGTTGMDNNGRAITGALGGIAAGTLVGIGMGSSVARHINSTSQEMAGNLVALAQGNYNVRATVGANDELGKLANSFNQMVSTIESSISELQQRAAEQGQAKEDLQRQVIRLLDDVEGAARGDLTVRAEVTADVLGAVADSFNLTIRSLRDIVSQVKRAAGAVNEAAFQNEEFARGLSADALRQAEDIARSLNSVQVMTESIQRVASNAREAAEVGRRASEAALRGGEAVDRAVSGILEIRETVAETTRQVKRLAESSQEINKIVALISQIASRTNLLALNASIEAARAGESGRGFAIVADEVRQLADRAAKSSKEIEQLVLQIQSETKTVMTAMENGTQQVIEGTRRAEQAKSSLDEIIEVSRTIDGLVRSISDATVQQTDTSRSVAQVMQTVELTANETAQESQKVAASLMQLVGIARELQASVGRFRVGDE